MKVRSINIDNFAIKDDNTNSSFLPFISLELLIYLTNLNKKYS